MFPASSVGLVLSSPGGLLFSEFRPAQCADSPPVPALGACPLPSAFLSTALSSAPRKYISSNFPGSSLPVLAGTLTGTRPSSHRCWKFTYITSPSSGSFLPQDKGGIVEAQCGSSISPNLCPANGNAVGGDGVNCWVSMSSTAGEERRSVSGELVLTRK